MNRKNDLKTYTSFQSINSDIIIACIDAFFPTVYKPTVIVMDQSSIHTSNAIFDKIEEWKERNFASFAKIFVGSYFGKGIASNSQISGMSSFGGASGSFSPICFNPIRN